MAAVQGVIILHSQVDPYLAGESLKLARKYLSGDNTFRSAFANNNYAICCLLLGELDEGAKR